MKNYASLTAILMISIFLVTLSETHSSTKKNTITPGFTNSDSVLLGIKNNSNKVAEVDVNLCGGFGLATFGILPLMTWHFGLGVNINDIQITLTQIYGGESDNFYLVTPRKKLSVTAVTTGINLLKAPYILTVASGFGLMSGTLRGKFESSGRYIWEVSTYEAEKISSVCFPICLEIGINPDTFVLKIATEAILSENDTVFNFSIDIGVSF